MQINKTNGNLRLYAEESNDLYNFLAEKITKENYIGLFKYGFLEAIVETKSVPPYKITIRVSHEYLNSIGKDSTFDGFFCEILDAMSKLFKSHKIKM